MWLHRLRAFVCVALVASGCAGKSTETYTVAGQVSVPGAGTDPVDLYVQLLDGTTFGPVRVAADGSYSLTVDLPKDSERLLIGAVVATDLERRAFAMIELGGYGTVSGALGEAAPGGLPGFVVDEGTTAEAILRTAAGRMDLPPGDFVQRHAGPIGQLGGALKSGPMPMCSVGASTIPAGTADTLSQTVRVVAEPREDGGPQVLKEMRAQAEKTTLPIEQRLRAMQEIVSYYIYSTNNPRLPGALDTPIGLVPMVLLRSGIYGLTGEDLVELNDKELSRDELGQLAGMIASIRWGNCREKAYLGAYAASLIPEVKQIVVVGMFVKGVGEHAAAIACLDGPEVYDMRNYGGTILGPPPGSEGRCFVVDPWAPAFNKLEPGKGHTALLTNDYASNASWEQVIVTKPIRLDGTIRAPLGGATMKVCAGGNDGEPSCSAPQPDPGAGDTGDAGTGGGFDAGGGGDAGGGVDAGPECPVYAPDGKECGASLEGCIEGFYCSTDTIACEQTECPEGSGRTYTLECCCNCWDDHSKVNVYDPCRAGFLIRCDPAP